MPPKGGTPARSTAQFPFETKAVRQDLNLGILFSGGGKSADSARRLPDFRSA
jgi:hypothetical protein